MTFQNLSANFKVSLKFAPVPGNPKAHDDLNRTHTCPLPYVYLQIWNTLEKCVKIRFSVVFERDDETILKTAWVLDKCITDPELRRAGEVASPMPPDFILTLPLLLHLSWCTTFDPFSPLATSRPVVISSAGVRLILHHLATFQAFLYHQELHGPLNEFSPFDSKTTKGSASFKKDSIHLIPHTKITPCSLSIFRGRLHLTVSAAASREGSAWKTSTKEALTTRYPVKYRIATFSARAQRSPRQHERPILTSRSLQDLLQKYWQL